MMIIHPLHPTGHATDGFLEFDGFFRVSRRVSGSFGEEAHEWHGGGGDGC
jgi:hypothetical protein